MQRSTVLVLVAIAALALGAPALAFHDGGVADCQGCHTMHNSQGGNPMNNDGLGGSEAVGHGYDELLLYPNKTDVCLACHGRNTASYGVWSSSVTTPNVYRANRGGGDFVFLEEDNINDGHGGATSFIDGEQSGHSVISIMKNTGVDSVNGTAPGGTYPADELYCSSCHDPHGTSSFRLLYQQGQQNSYGTDFNYTLEAEGVGLSTTVGESNGNHNYYKANYSEWCATCHGDFHASSGNLVHPSGETLTAEVVAQYDAYQGTENCVNNPPASAGDPCGNGVHASSYLYMVPFEDADDTTYGITSVEGPTTSSKVACVTCHRAHATSARDAGRWDFQIAGLAEDGHESSSYAMLNPYNEYQRSLCNKCHGQDEYDELVDFTP